MSQSTEPVSPSAEQVQAALAEADHIAQVHASGFGIIPLSRVPYHMPVLAAEVRRLSAALAEKEEELQKWKIRHDGLVLAITEMQSDRQEVEAQLTEKDTEITRLKEHHQRDEAMIVQRTEQVRFLRASLTEKQTELEAVKKELKEEKSNAQTAIDNIFSLREIHATPGKLDLTIEQDPAIATTIAKAFATLIQHSTNYTELSFSARATPGETITVLVQKHTGKTPHQLRAIAEAQLASQQEALVAAGDALNDIATHGPMMLTSFPPKDYAQERAKEALTRVNACLPEGTK